MSRRRRIGVEFHPEDVLPGAFAARPGLELAHVQAVPCEHLEHRKQGTRLVAHRERERGPWRAAFNGCGHLRAGRRKDEEPRAIVRDVLDVVREDLESEQGCGTRREDSGSAPLAPLGDGFAGAGSVVGREQLPWPRPQERLGLAQGLDV